MTRIKICGLTTVEESLECAALGAEAIGVNFVASSPRRISVQTARAIVDAIGSRALVVAVVADMTIEAMQKLRGETSVGCLQLHGEETPETVLALLPHAYKAIRVANARDVALADRMPGEFVMVDAKVEGALGGTGHKVETGLVVALSTRRRLVLAGGLTPENVGQAVREVAPWCVDVASGVERAPGAKDLSKVRAFVQAVRAADAQTAS